VPQAKLFQLMQLIEVLFEALIEVVEDFVKAQISCGVLATDPCFSCAHSFRRFWHGTCWTDVGRSLQVWQTAIYTRPLLAGRLLFAKGASVCILRDVLRAWTDAQSKAFRSFWDLRTRQRRLCVRLGRQA